MHQSVSEHDTWFSKNLAKVAALCIFEGPEHHACDFGRRRGSEIVVASPKEKICEPLLRPDLEEG